MWVFLILVVVPIVEIALFIRVGGFIGTWPTLGIVVLTALVGSILMRTQGIATLHKLQHSLGEGSNPATHLAHGALILVAGVLLLTPGFFTDSIGISLLIPPLRALVIKWGAARFTAHVVGSTVHFSSDRPDQNDIIEGDFTELPDDDAPKGSSGWTKPPDN